jgi:hypothetical protein
MTPTLSQLLSDPQARENAPVRYPRRPEDWQLLRSGRLFRAVIDVRDHKLPIYNLDAPIDDCIWSGDLVAELAAVDALRAENERLREGFSDLIDWVENICNPWDIKAITEARQALKGLDA